MIIYSSVKCNGAGLRLNDDHIAGLLAAVTVRVKSMCQMYSALLRLQERRPRRHYLVVLILLIEHPNVHLHYTPTYSSWLNQVELWFAKVERDVIARGVFTSVTDLRRKLMRNIRKYNNAPNPVKWIYRDPVHRITTDSDVTVH